VSASTVLRDRSVAAELEVTKVELFFDLVYVFAVTQLSQYLLDHLTGRGAVQTLVLFVAVWWAWNYTAWATNWVDPRHAAVRALLLVLMLFSLVMSAAIPRAFDGRAVMFAAAYVGLQAVRSAFMVAAYRGLRMGRNWTQLLAWTLIAGAAWLAGAFAHGDLRLLLWIVAVVLDVGAPLHGFALPGLGRTPTRDWTLAGGHLAERFQLVVLIALGESILALGRTFSELNLSAPVVAAFAAGFVTAVALWWIYFVGYAEAGGRTVAAAEDPTALARTGYAYAHAIMVAAVIVVAVGIERTITHPTGPTGTATALVILAGPAIYLAGTALFKFTLWRRPPWPPLIAVAILAALGLLALAVTPLVLSAAAALVAVTLALMAGR
jgi:low temperature requirement protein LtrA